MRKYFLFLFLFASLSVFAQSFSLIADVFDTDMKYQIIEDFNNGREIWEFYENNIKYVFMKTNIYLEPDYIYFEYDMILNKRILTFEGSLAVWIHGERSITCLGINRVFVIESSGSDL